MLTRTFVILSMLFAVMQASDVFMYDQYDIVARTKILKKYQTCKDNLDLGKPAQKAIEHYSKAVLSDIDCLCDFQKSFDQAVQKGDQDFCYALAWLRDDANTHLVNSDQKYRLVPLKVRIVSTKRLTVLGRTPLMKACIAGDEERVVEIAQSLLKKDLNAQDEHGNTALMLACEHMQYDVVRALLLVRKNKKLLVDLTITNYTEQTAWDKIVEQRASNDKDNEDKQAFEDGRNRIMQILRIHPDYVFEQEPCYEQDLNAIKKNCIEQKNLEEACKHGMWYFAKKYLEDTPCCMTEEMHNDLFVGILDSQDSEFPVAKAIWYTFHAERWPELSQKKVYERHELVKAYKRFKRGYEQPLYSVLVAEPMVLGIKANMNHLIVCNIENIKRLFEVKYFLRTIQFMEYQYPGEKKYWDIYAQALTAALHKK